jgi:hypothetical protein
MACCGHYLLLYTFRDAICKPRMLRKNAPNIGGNIALHCRWWRRMARQRNDYFQWGGPEAIAVGGAGG